MYLGFGGVFAILAFAILFVALGGGDHPFLSWILLFGFGGGSWYCYRKHKQIEEDKLDERQNNSAQKLWYMSDHKSSQKYVSADHLSTLSIDETNKQIAFVAFGASNNKTYNYRDILKSEILTDGFSVTSTNRGSQIGGALLGGLLAGGVGALIGGLSGSTTSEEKLKRIELNIIVNDAAKPVHKMAFLDAEFSVTKSSPEYKEAYEKAYHCHQLLGVLIRQADEEDKRKEMVDSTQAQKSSGESINSSIADELRKLADLRNEGIISSEDFEMQKKKLIG